MSGLWAAVRSTPMRWLVPVVLLADAAMLLFGQVSWRGDWLLTVDTVGLAGVLVGPLVCGAAAWHVWQVRHRWPGVVARTAPTLLARHVLGPDLVVVVAAQAGAMLLALAVTAASNPVPIPYVWQALAPLGLLAAAVALGYLAGVLVPAVVTAPVMSLAVFLLPWAVYGGPVPRLWVEVGGSTAPLVGLRPVAAVTWLQVVLGAGLVLTAAGLAPGRRPWRGWRSPAVASVSAGGALVAVLAAAQLGGLVEDRFEPAPAERVCSADTVPVVCTFRGAERSAHAVAALARGLADRERELGLSATPRVLVQVHTADDPVGPGEVAFALPPGDVGDPGLLAEVVLPALVVRGPCLLEDGALVDGAGQLDLAAQWLARSITGVAVPSADPAALAALDALPAPAQRRWLAHTLSAARQCELPAAPPFPGGRG